MARTMAFTDRLRDRVSLGTRTEAKGKRDYKYIGPLTEQDLRFLATQNGDNTRRRILNSWYGACGAAIAWEEWNKWLMKTSIKL